MASKEGWSAHYGGVFAFPKEGGIRILPLVDIISWELCTEIARGDYLHVLLSKEKLTEDLKKQLMVVAKMALSVHQSHLK